MLIHKSTIIIVAIALIAAVATVNHLLKSQPTAKPANNNKKEENKNNIVVEKTIEQEEIKEIKEEIKEEEKVLSKDTETVYIAATGKKYHRENCRMLKEGKQPLALEEAQAKGYTSCGICFK